MRRSLLALGAAALGSSMAAAITGENLDAPCYEACLMALNPIKFSDSQGSVPEVKDCQSNFAVSSLYLCARAYCSEQNRVEGLLEQNKTCQAKVRAALPPWSIVANYTDEDVMALRRVEKFNWENATTFDEVVVPSAHLFHLAYDTLDAWAYTHKHHFLYSLGMFAFWALVIGIGFLGRCMAGLSRFAGDGRLKQRRNSHLEEDFAVGQQRKRWELRPHPWLQRHITIPATFGYRTSQAFGWYTVPPRIQSLTILAFVVLNIVFCVHGYRIFADNLWFPELHTQIWRYLSDRTGTISFANFPLIWLFGMRNNLLVWLTGWDFGTYTNFHRWVARVATAQAVIHSIGYTVLVLDHGGWPLYSQYWEQLWWTTGGVATVAMCAMIPLSLFYLRRTVYELFLVLHILLSFVVLITMLAHISIFQGSFDVIIWVCVAIWLVDRLMRVGRTLAFNNFRLTVHAEAVYDPDADVIRLSIPCFQSLYTPRIGTFYYLHLLDSARFWESHPFTMAKIQYVPGHGGKQQEAGLPPASSDEGSSLLRRSQPDNPTDLSDGEVQSDAQEPTMSFLIRPYDSFTKRLKHAAGSATQPTYLPMLVEGPYGHTQPFDRFEHVLFVVGGSGIVVPLVYLERLCGTPGGAKMHIIWAIREPGFAASVVRQDLCEYQDALQDGRLSLDVYLTRGHRSEANMHLPEGALLHHGRPDVSELVDEAVRELGRSGTVAVVSCGPARMNDDARRATARSLGKAAHAVEYFEESFSW